METQIFSGRHSDTLDLARDLLQAGEVVAFPTETVYGLGADALNPNAVQKIYSAKGRPSDNPLIVHIGDSQQLENLVTHVSPHAKKLMEAFWPGPLTLIFKKQDCLPASTTGGLDTVAIRIPNHPVALQLLRHSSIPLAAPSANLSGRPSPTTAQHVWDDMHGRIPLILDGGACNGGVESTVLDISDDTIQLLRPGLITPAMIQSVLGDTVPFKISHHLNTTKSPGMKYTHYSPRIPIILVEGSPEPSLQEIKKIVQEKKEPVALLTHSPFHISDDALVFHDIFDPQPDIFSRNLFALLRDAEKKNASYLIIEGIPDNGLGLAVMNRLRKAAQQIYHVDT